DPSPEAMLFLMTGLPKMIQLEEGFGILAAHDEIVELVERYLDSNTWGAHIGNQTKNKKPRATDAPAKRRRARLRAEG
ncbi:MAG: hypothetical protein ABW364_09275, partial [Rhodococcus fascians]